MCCDSSDKDFPSYKLSDPGMYSVVLKVEDSSGNAAFARGLFLWDSRSNVSVTGRPMTVSGDTGNGDGFSWLTSSVHPTHPLGVNWHGHFENAFQHNNKLLNKVKKWPVDKGIDDLEGNRTLAAIPNVNGIVQFYIGHGHVDRSAPTTWIDVEEDHYELRTTITDGEFIRVFVKAVDVMGNNATDSLVVGVDSSPPRFVEYTFQKNVESGRPLLPYSSRINMKANDRESGIRSIQYIVNDVTTGTEVWNGTVNGQKETENTQQCLDAATCDCTPMNECYYLTQVFYLDNCWFLHGEGHEYQIDATIFNHAGLSTATQLKVSWLSLGYYFLDFRYIEQ
ncbi:hypothetical protein LSAT2_008678 [Lamellibrachia satsuma]|nr:hypothetical protein LSAT2_008678 [Lamellibrachia satsuma]